MSIIFPHSFDLLNIKGGVSNFVAYLWKMKVESIFWWHWKKGINIKGWILFFKLMRLHFPASTFISAFAHQDHRVFFVRYNLLECIIHSYKKMNKLQITQITWFWTKSLIDMQIRFYRKKSDFIVERTLLSLSSARICRGRAYFE